MMQPALFKVYPGLQEQIPWISILKKPTPVRRMSRLEEFLNTEEAIWVKLDNLTSEKYGGNKVRKLEFILADALYRKKQTIATTGGLGTNHGLATTIHGQAHNLKTRLYLVDQPITPAVLQNLKLMHYYNAHLIYSKNTLRQSLRFHVLDRLRCRNTYWLPTGGSTPIGVLGYVNAVFELVNQIRSGLLPEPRRIFVPAGSVGTLAGIELGLQLTGLKTQVRGIAVTDKRLANPTRVQKLVRAALSILRQDDEIITTKYVPRFELIRDFFGKEYGRPTKAGKIAMQLATECEQLTLDPTYTSKTLAGLIEYIRHGNQGPILYWHTFNSVDLTSFANQVDYRELPVSFHSFFK